MIAGLFLSLIESDKLSIIHETSDLTWLGSITNNAFNYWRKY